MITELILFGAIALGLAGARKDSVSGVGAIKRAKRRVYKEIAEAQKRGVDLERPFSDYSENGKKLLESTGRDFGWKQSKRSIESGKSYAEAYYNSLRRAYNAIAGISGVGGTYSVRNGNGDVILTWTEAEPLLVHVKAEAPAVDLETKEAELRKMRRKLRGRSRNFNIAPEPEASYQDEQKYQEQQFPTEATQLDLPF